MTYIHEVSLTGTQRLSKPYLVLSKLLCILVPTYVNCTPILRLQQKHNSYMFFLFEDISHQSNTVNIWLNVFLSFRGIKIMWIFIHNY